VADRYKKIVYDGAAIEALFVDAFIQAHTRTPGELVLDLDATDDPLHGHQEGRFFHGYYGCYCYLPLYIFCGDFLLCAKLRTADRDGAAGALEEVARIVAQIRACWPQVDHLAGRFGLRPRGVDAGASSRGSISFSGWPATRAGGDDQQRTGRGRGAVSGQR